MQEKISFIHGDSTFAAELKKRVDNYFKSRGLKQTGNFRLYSKTLILFAAFASIYCLLMFVSMPFWASIGLCVLFGITIASIGFNVMHDGAHGSYSSKNWVNEFMGHSLNLLGGNVYLWKFKHNILHHTFTNIEEHDEDIDIKPLMRVSVTQKKYWFHKYQHIYWIVLYAQMYFWWVYFKDFTKYFEGKIAGRQFTKMSISEHLIFWLSKVLHIALFVVIPLMIFSVSQWAVGFIVTMVVVGITISVVFQLAHVVPTTSFPLPNTESNKIEQNWVLHQLATTANFSPNSKIISWFAGGLNFQVEHHLFPRISHIHYPALRKVVMELCRQRNVPYLEYPTFFGAIKAHIFHLRDIGRA